MLKIVGYGICGGGEAGRYMKNTAFKSFKELCDETIILGNNITDKERTLIKEFGFHLVEDDREWGKNQHIMKEDFLKNNVALLNPDATVCLDMDEELVATRDKLEEWARKGQAWYVYIANLWNDGYRSDWSFWNVRFWSWGWKDKLGEGFFKFENRPLHCGLAPKWAYHLNLHAPFMLKHYGLKKEVDRRRKIRRYKKYDPNQVYRHPSYYRALSLNTCEPFNQEKIQFELDNHINSLNQPLNKELPMQKKNKREFLVVREKDGLTFPVPEKFISMQLKRKYKGMGFKLVEEMPKYTI